MRKKHRAGHFESAAIGKRIAMYRKASDMTLKKLSEKSGMSAPTLCRIENGTGTLTLEAVERLSVCLGVKETDLLIGNDGDLALMAALERCAGDDWYKEYLWVALQYFELPMEERISVLEAVKMAVEEKSSGKGEGLDASRVAETAIKTGYLDGDLELIERLITPDKEQREELRIRVESVIAYVKNKH